jgi:hypothetical protein
MNTLGGDSPLWTDDRGEHGLYADPAIVVREFARTRRNRTILTTVLAVLGFFVVGLPLSLGVGTAIYLLIFAVAYYRIIRSRKREKEDAGSFSAIAGTLQEIEQGPRERPRVLGYDVSRRWLIKRSLLTFDFVSTADICWVYGKNTKHYINFIPAHTTSSIEVKLRSGRTLSDSLSEGGRSRGLALLRQLAPWAFFGYSDELKQVWGKDRIDFVHAVDVRIAGYR